MRSKPDAYHALAQGLENRTKLGAGECTAIEVGGRSRSDTSAVKLHAYVGGCASTTLRSLLEAHELGHISKEYLLSELSKIDVSEMRCSKCMIERIKELIEQLYPAAPIALKESILGNSRITQTIEFSYETLVPDPDNRKHSTYSGNGAGSRPSGKD